MFVQPLSKKSGQDFEVEVQAKLEFGQFFSADVLQNVESKMNLGRDSEARFGQDFEVEFQAKFEAGVWSVSCC